MYDDVWREKYCKPSNYLLLHIYAIVNLKYILKHSYPKHTNCLFATKSIQISILFLNYVKNLG